MISLAVVKVIFPKLHVSVAKGTFSSFVFVFLNFRVAITFVTAEDGLMIHDSAQLYSVQIDGTPMNVAHLVFIPLVRIRFHVRTAAFEHNPRRVAAERGRTDREPISRI